MPDFACACCGATHEGSPFSFHFEAPAYWYTIPDAERDARTILTPEQCEIDGQHFFVKARIRLPVLDGPHPFE
jgi:hypothetical protein